MPVRVRLSRVGRPLTAALLVVSIGAAGCTDDAPATAAPSALAQPPESAFREGSCRVAAPDILSLGRDAAQLGEGPSVPEALIATVEDSQSRLDEIAQGVEPELRPAFDELVVAAGFVRLRGVGNTYDRDLGLRMSNAYDALVALCTGPAPSASPTSNPTSVPTATRPGRPSPS